MKRIVFEEKLDWRKWLTPTALAGKSVHRWYYFPHSFTNDLVHALIDEWGLGEKHKLLDPFCGAGTTVLAAKEKAVPATGYDLSPLAVFTTNVKVANYSHTRLSDAWRRLDASVDPSTWNGTTKTYPYLVKKALPGARLGAFDAIQNTINRCQCSPAERDFFRMALLRVLRLYSRAVPTGGWLSWTENRRRIGELPAALGEQVELMIEDLRNSKLPWRAEWTASQADARNLPEKGEHYSAVITSPPYPNRHDYTRVFGVELMFSFLNWIQTRRLRYQSFESHPEGHPKRPKSDEYVEPPSLTRVLRQLKKEDIDPRIPAMLRGYFLDMFLCLRETTRVCRPGARVAFVLGNAQYSGHPILVDEFTAVIGQQVGLTCKRIVEVRRRGNSAQQMGIYGRRPARESVVIFEKPRR